MKRHCSKQLIHCLAVFAIIVFAVIIACPPYIIKAEGGAKILGVRRGDNSLSIYVDNSEPIDSCEVQIGSRIYEADSISSSGEVYTVLIINFSDPSYTDSINAVVSEIVDHHADGERFLVVSMKYPNEIISGDFTTDYDKVKSCVAGASYAEHVSNYSYSVYDILNGIGNNSANYARLITISDGVDNDPSLSRVDEELSQLSRTTQIPIYTICINGDQNPDAATTAAFYSRLTGGESINLPIGATAADYVTRIAVDESVQCITVTPGLEVLDGSEQTIRLNYDTSSGSYSVETEAVVKMPLATVTATPVPTDTPTPTPTETEESLLISADSNKKVSDNGEEKDTGNKFDLIKKILIAAACLIVVGIIILSIMTLVRRKLSHKDAANEVEDSPETQSLYNEYSGGSLLKSAAVQALTKSDDLPDPVAFVVFRDNDDRSIVYSVPIYERITVGREGCDLNIRAGWMSKRHCEIEIKQGNFYINDLHSTSGTYVNNAMVIKETLLADGAQVRLGTKTFTVNFEVE